MSKVDIRPFELSAHTYKGVQNPPPRVQYRNSINATIERSPRKDRHYYGTPCFRGTEVTMNILILFKTWTRMESEEINS